MKLLKRLIREDDGATMVEYGLLVALISVAAIVIIGVLGGQINDAFTEVSEKISAETGGGNGD